MKTFLRYLAWYGGGLLLLGLTVAPLARPAWFATPLVQAPAALWSIRIGLLALTPLGAFLCLHSYPAVRRERWLLVLLILLSAGFCEQLVHQFVDKGHYFGGGNENSAYQLRLQHAVVALDPAEIPHAYRFASHSIVAIFQWLGGSFELARGAYRLLFNTLLFAAIFRYSRLFLGTPASVAVVLVMLLVYPITIAWFAGQFVDPMSHLSFVACLYFFARGFEPGIAPTVLVGVFAKESVAALTICRAFYGPRRPRALLLAAAYFAVALAGIVAIRYLVNQHSFAYNRISGVGTNQFLANLRGYDEWPFQYLYTLLILLPGARLGWRKMDRPFRLTCVFLTLALVISSALFSWLNEVRNLVPALLMLAIVNLKYIESRFVAEHYRHPLPS